MGKSIQYIFPKHVLLTFPPKLGKVWTKLLTVVVIDTNLFYFALFHGVAWKSNSFSFCYAKHLQNCDLVPATKATVYISKVWTNLSSICSMYDTCKICTKFIFYSKVVQTYIPNILLVIAVFKNWCQVHFFIKALKNGLRYFLLMRTVFKLEMFL